MSGLVLLLLSTQVAASSGALDLETAIQLAMKRNERQQIAEERLEQARAARRKAYALLFPSLSLRATYRRRSEGTTFGEVTIRDENALSGVATFEATVIDAQAFPMIDRADLDLEAQGIERQESRRALAFEVAESFLSALMAEGTASAAQRRQTLAAHAVENAAARVDAGLAPSRDLNRSQLELASAKLASTRADNAVRLTRLDLGFLIAGEIDGPLVPPSSVDGPTPPDPVADAIGGRRDLQAAQARARAAEAAARAPWMRLVPSLGVSAELRATNETGFSGRVFDWDLAATLRWDIFDGGARYADAAIAESLARERSLDADALRRRIATEVRGALANLATARAAVTEAKAQLELAGTHHQEVRARFDQGLATALEHADAAVLEFEAALDLERQELGAGLGALRLRRALGAWPTIAAD